MMHAQKWKSSTVLWERYLHYQHPTSYNPMTAGCGKLIKHADVAKLRPPTREICGKTVLPRGNLHKRNKNRGGHCLKTDRYPN